MTNDKRKISFKPAGINPGPAEIMTAADCEWLSRGMRQQPEGTEPRKLQRCKRCGAFEGDAMFTTLKGSGICDDCL